MNILINASNLKAGGGLQVAQSICNQLCSFPCHHFIVVLSTYINTSNIRFGNNTEVYCYEIRHDIKTVLFGRDTFLDGLVKEKEIESVLTIFGPSIWRPRVPHLCGFARAQLILKDSPYYLQRSWREKVLCGIWKWSFGRSSRFFYTENKYTSKLLEKYLKGVRVYTVTNYYNQIYDHPGIWKRSIELPHFDGITCLTVSSPAPHKNLSIIDGIVSYLKENDSGLKVRFVLTCNKSDLPFLSKVEAEVICVGKIDVAECPYLYEQSDIMFMPSLMECFTATYPEAMRMEVPIVTTDLEFAKGLCGDAACYYSAVDAKAAAEAIFQVAKDKEYAKQLVENGKKQLLTYDNYEQRTEKLIGILEDISKENNK